jgi:hypothetical protein
VASGEQGPEKRFDAEDAEIGTERVRRCAGEYCRQRLQKLAGGLLDETGSSWCLGSVNG